MSGELSAAADTLAAKCDKITFGAPVTHTYNPLQYARKPHQIYLQKFGGTPKKAVFWGMNPGPWGMAQTGVPFGEVSAVRDWMGISATVQAPANTHPKRPVLGFNCPRSEVSGRRLWGLFAHHYSAAADFFSDYLVLNYCPLLFLQAQGSRCTNLTPDKLSATARKPLFTAADEHMRQATTILRPQYLIGIGDFAAARLRAIFTDSTIKIGKILHPSPASPLANKNFAARADQQLRDLGVW